MGKGFRSFVRKVEGHDPILEKEKAGARDSKRYYDFSERHEFIRAALSAYQARLAESSGPYYGSSMGLHRLLDTRPQGYSLPEYTTSDSPGQPQEEDERIAPRSGPYPGTRYVYQYDTSTRCYILTDTTS